MILNTTTCTHSFTAKDHHSRCYSNTNNFKDLCPTTITASLLPQTLLPFSGLPVLGKKSKRFSSNGWKNSSCITIRRSRITASLIESPLLWAGRVCIFYALLKAGLVGSPSNPFCNTTELETGGDHLGFSKWFKDFRANPEKEAADKRKFVSKWHPTTKGTLKRSYRVPSKSEGRRLLKAITSLLSEDDHFIDATSHKGCQIRRESAHGETVCCNNVRALFDELPTPHLVVEITPFPVGPLTENDYAKAEKLEKVLRTGTSI